MKDFFVFGALRRYEGETAEARWLRLAGAILATIGIFTLLPTAIAFLKVLAGE